MLRVRLDGSLRQIFGRSGLLLPLPASRRLADVLAMLNAEYPGVLGEAADLQWRHGGSHIVVAVNHKVVEGQDMELAEGDEIELLPPLGGGLAAN